LISQPALGFFVVGYNKKEYLSMPSFLVSVLSLNELKEEKPIVFMHTIIFQNQRSLTLFLKALLHIGINIMPPLAFL
jgi:hypothetical protein